MTEADARERGRHIVRADPEPAVLCLNFLEDEQKHRRKLEGVRRFARTQGWHVVAVPPRESGPAAVRAILARHRPAGCIIDMSLPRRSLSPERFCGANAVWLDLPEPSACPGAEAVVCDNAAVAKAAFRELSAGLPSCFAAVPSHGMQRWSAERIEAFRALCEGHGFDCRVFPGIAVRRGRVADDLVRRRKRLAEWMSSLPAGCAVFAANDYSAQDVIAAAEAIGRGIPRELTLVGVDGWMDGGRDDSLSRVSSVQIDFELAGYLAAKRLSETSRGGARPDAFGPLCVLRRKSTSGRGRRDPHVLAAVDVIRREACDGLTAAALAARMPGSRKHFERRFREAMGHSVLDEIMHVRIQAAKDLLSKPEPPIGAVADFCGFGSRIELRIAFRAHTGMSMRQWRQMHVG